MIAINHGLQDILKSITLPIPKKVQKH